MMHSHDEGRVIGGYISRVKNEMPADWYESVEFWIGDGILWLSVSQATQESVAKMLEDPHIDGSYPRFEPKYKGR